MDRLRNADLASVIALLGPTALLGTVLLTRICRTVPWPAQVHKSFRASTFPFRNFFTSEHFAEPLGPPLKPAVWKTRSMTILSTAECMVYVATLARLVIAIDFDSLELPVCLVGLCAWAYSTATLALNPPVTPPFLLLALYLCYIVSTSLNAYQLLLGSSLSNLFHLAMLFLQFALFVSLAWLAGTLPLLSYLPSPSVAELGEKPASTESSPEDRANLWQWCTFSFVRPMLDLSTTQTINSEDVWALSPYFSHMNLFNAYLKYREQYPTHSLLRYLIVSSSFDLFLDVATEMYGAVAGFSVPYALQQILAAIVKNTQEGRLEAYKWTFLIFAANVSFAQIAVFQRWHTRRCYERTRGLLFCALHFKALQRRDHSGQTGKDDDPDAASSADLGKVVNLMQGDSYAVAQRFWEFSGIFSSPVRLSIALYFLWQVLGWSSLLGVAVVLVTYVLNYPLAKYNVYVTRSSWKAKDKRMTVINELFQNIRFLKVNGWQTTWSSQARAARETELQWRVKQNAVDTITSFIWGRIPAITTLVCFWSYTLFEGERLTVSKAFTAMALFGSLQGPMTQLPGQIFALIHAYVSLQRIESFLREEEVPNWATSLQKHDPMAYPDMTGFTHASFAWSQASASRFTLGPLNVAFPHGKLSIVCGATGSGKTALLSSLLGEMHCLGGEVSLNKENHQVAYCAQNPWLEHATIRENIIFGSARGYDINRYQEVLHACALAKDLEMFDAGDMTEIGERGITLSGGQRARVAMARALYSDASCILLDDPLAAVDMHTAAHLLEHALSGDRLARGRTIILVTHHVRLCLPHAGYVVELGDGQIMRAGTPTELDHLGLLEEVIQEEDVQQSASGSTQNEITEDEIEDSLRPTRIITDGKLVEEEARAEGRVSLRTYVTYIRAAGIAPWFITIFLMIVMRALTTLQQLFIAKWGEAYEQETSSGEVFNILRRIPNPLDRLPPPSENVKPWFLVFFIIFAASSLSTLLYIILGYYASLQASRKLFNDMLSNLTQAPARFFDRTPIGRILNRFTSDMGTVDGALQFSARNALQETFNFISNIIVIGLVVPSFVPFAVVIFWLYVRLAPPYIRTSRDLRRLESVSLSPAFAGFDELLQGIKHIRAFAFEGRFQSQFYKRVDTFQLYDHAYWLVSIWLSYRYDMLGSLVVLLTGIFALAAGVSDGYAALVFVQAQAFADATRYLVRVAAQLELDFNSVERIVEYLDVPQEKGVGDQSPPAHWPSSGTVVVENLVVRYAPELDAVLKNLSFSIKSSEKIGVVGRTGSGKSTLGLSCLRMVEASEGRIVVDGIDIAKVGLDTLRSKITIVSQDTALFNGTIRSNLDPFGDHTDQECYDVLAACHLKPLLDRGLLNGGSVPVSSALDMPITANSLSAGEKQLLSLARAVLRRTNIVILDEATAQVDHELDDKVQQTIRTDLSHATVIAIAHRLKTILDYDRVMVLDKGHIVEFATPLELLRRPGSSFGDLCRRSADWPLLRTMAERHSASAPK